MGFHRGRECWRRRGTRLRHNVLCLFESTLRSDKFGIDRRGEFVMPFEFHQASIGIVSPCNDLGQVFAVFAPEILQQLSAVPDEREPLRVIFDPFGTGPQFSSKVIDLGRCVAQTTYNVGEDGAISQTGDRATEGVACSPVGTEGIERDNGCVANSTCIGKKFRFVPKFVVLLDIVEPSGDEFIDLKAKKVEFTSTISGVATERGPLGIEFRYSLPGLT